MTNEHKLPLLIMLKLKGNLQYELPSAHPLRNHSKFICETILNENHLTTTNCDRSLIESGLLALVWHLYLNEEIINSEWLPKYHTLLDFYKGTDPGIPDDTEELALRDFQEYLVNTCLPMCKIQSNHLICREHILGLTISKVSRLLYVDCSKILTLTALEFWVQWFELDDLTSRQVALQNADFFVQQARNALRLSLPNSSFTWTSVPRFACGALSLERVKLVLRDQEYEVTHDMVIPWNSPPKPIQN